MHFRQFECSGQGAVVPLKSSAAGESGKASDGAAAWLSMTSAPEGRNAEMTGITNWDSQALTPVLGSRSPSVMPWFQTSSPNKSARS